MAAGWAPFVPLLVIMPLQLITLGLAVWWVRRWLRGRSRRAAGGPIAVDGDGHDIPVLATFAGVRGMPWWYAVARNNANPRLQIKASGLSFRVLRRRQRPFAAIEQVDVRTAPLTCNLKILFVGELLTFSANLGTPAAAGAALALLPDRVPLTPRAQAIRDAATGDGAGSPSPA